MAPRGKRAVGRKRGSNVARGRGRTSVQTVKEIVNDTPILDTQQEILDEEREEESDDEDEVMDVADDDITINGTEPLPLPGNPIPTFTVQSWRAQWRKDFFSDWRWAEKKKGSGQQVWARCKTGTCQTNKKPHYYSGELTSFSNFEKHLNSCHYEEYSKYEKRRVNDSRLSQPTLLKFQQFRTMTKDRQKQIDLDIGYKQEILDEEREEGGGDEDEVMDVTDVDTTINGTEPLPPPGNPIPKFTVQSWKAQWRRDFFSDWRWAEKKKGSGHQVWARCITGKCQTNNKPRYYSGELTSFSNFEKHLKSCHYEEYSKYEKHESLNDSSSSQPTLLKFQQFQTMTKDQQKQIDLDLGYIQEIATNFLVCALDEDREEGGEAEVNDVSDDDTIINGTEPLPPPGNPIPKFTVHSWKAHWRRDFFSDWRWAEKKKGSGHQVWARCITGICQTNKKPRYYSGELTSFSNFEKHLKSCHYEEYSKYEKHESLNDSSSSQPTLLKFQQFQTMTKNRQKQIDLDLGYTVAIDNIPINILRRPRFRRWIHSAVPGYQLPGIERMRNSIIPDIVHATRMKLIKIIEESTSFTIILDIWSSKSLMGFIGFTCHAVTKTFERYTLFLGVKRMIGRHTAVNILAEYEQLLLDWEIDRSLVLMVKTDGGSNMVANTLLNSIPGWNNEEELSVNEHSSADYDDSQPSTSVSDIPDRENNQTIQPNEPMIEVEIADSIEDDPLWLLLQKWGIKFSDAGVHDDDDGREYRDLEKELEEPMPSNENTPAEVGDEYVLFSRLRSDCVALKLELVIKDGFKTLSREATGVISHLSKLINSARKCVIDSDMIYNSLGFRLSKKNSTRWNSTFYELENFMKAIENDPTLLTRLNAVKMHGPLSAYQRILLKEIIAILKPFEAASNDFQADFETVGNVIPAYLGLMNALSLTIKDRNGMQIANPTSRLASMVKYCKGFVAGLRESLERRFSFIQRDANYVMGSIFDPRFKCAWIKQAGLNEQAVLNAVSSEIELRYDLFRSRQAAMVSTPNQQTEVKQDSVSSPNDLAVKPSSNRKRRLSQSLYSTVIEGQRPRSASGPAKALEEFVNYLKEPLVDMEVLVNPMDPNSDLCATKPLEYWKSNQSRFPILSKIGRDVVSVAASSGSIERTFSVASDILTAKQSEMKPDLFVNLMLIKCNAGLKVGLVDV